MRHATGWCNGGSTWRGEGAPKDSPASLALAMPVLAQGPLAGEGLAASAGWACTVPPGGTLHENLPVASGPLSLHPASLSANKSPAMPASNFADCCYAGQASHPGEGAAQTAKFSHCVQGLGHLECTALAPLTNRKRESTWLQGG